MADFDEDMLLNQVREMLRNQPTGSRVRPKPDEFKVSELPEFNGGTNPEEYLEWERKIERMFDFKDVSDEKRCKYAILRLGRGASLWFEGLKQKRVRAGKEKMASWESLKRKLRKRYVPLTHKLTTYRKIAEFKQGKLSVGEYIDEFEGLSLMGELEEIEELKMSRFLRGLNPNIANIVDLYPYSDFDGLCGLCLKLETQFKPKYGGGSEPKPKSWAKPESSYKSNFPNNDVSPLVNPTAGSSSATPKSTNTPKETSLSKVRCFKCQGFGHYQSACPNKRIVTLREAVEYRVELLEEEERIGDVFNLGVNEEEEGSGDVESYTAPKYDCSLVLRTLAVHSTPIESEQRDQIFHTKCQVKDRWCSLIIDGGSCTNAASTEMVSKLGLVTTPHPRPYALHWLDDGNKVSVTKQTRVALTMGSYGDEILCDVVPMDACHILLGRPWQFDRNVIHYGRSNEYEVVDRGRKLLLKPMAPSEIRSMNVKRGKTTKLSMFAGEKEVNNAIIDGTCVYWLMAREAKEGVVSNLQVAELLEEYRDVFPDDLPPGLPPIRGIEHQIDLIPGAPLPNKAVYRCNPIETKELQRQIEELMDRGYVRESMSPCAVPTL